MAYDSSCDDGLNLLLIGLLLSWQLNNVLNTEEQFEVDIAIQDKVNKIGMLTKRVNRITRLISYLLGMLGIRYDLR